MWGASCPGLTGKRFNFSVLEWRVRKICVKLKRVLILNSACQNQTVIVQFHLHQWAAVQAENALRLTDLLLHIYMVYRNKTHFTKQGLDTEHVCSSSSQWVATNTQSLQSPIIRVYICVLQTLKFASAAAISSLAAAAADDSGWGSDSRFQLFSKVAHPDGISWVVILKSPDRTRTSRSVAGVTPECLLLETSKYVHSKP